MSLITPELLPDPEAPAPPFPGEAPAVAAARWALPTRLAFRFSFCYLMVYALCSGNATLWEIIPFHLGEHLEDWTSWPFFHGAQWLGQHLFHLTGVGAKLHDTGSGDTMMNWIAVGIMLAFAVVVTPLWTALGELPPSRRALAYPRLFFWFRLTLRLTLGVAMLGYGLSKLVPLQMGAPSLAVLNEPLGNTSPMTMLWTLIGMSPVYEMVCGAAEVAAGVLILFRRTALVGALLTAFLTTNIVLYNFCFDVPVKIYAAHLLFMSIAVLAPDLRALFHFFFLYRPCVPTGGWLRPARRYGIRLETLITVVVILLAAGPQTFGSVKYYSEMQARQRHPGPLTGQWHLDSAMLAGKPAPYLTGDGLPMTDLFLEPNGRAMARDTSAVLWNAHTTLDDKKHTLSLGSIGHDPETTYAITQPDPQHLLLTPTDKLEKTESALAFTRVPLPASYPLLERGFHFVNEWGLRR